MVDYEKLLFGSESLTAEAEELTAEIDRWIGAKLAAGARPVPLWAALTLGVKVAKDPEAYGLGDQLRIGRERSLFNGAA